CLFSSARGSGRRVRGGGVEPRGYVGRRGHWMAAAGPRWASRRHVAPNSLAHRPCRDRVGAHIARRERTPVDGCAAIIISPPILSPRGDPVHEKSLFEKFWIDESETTRKVISRIPEGSDYRPDPKSRTAQEIAWQIVCEEKMLIDALESGKAEWSPPPLPSTMKEVLDTYEKQKASMADRFRNLPVERWDGDLEFFGSQRPASPLAWSFL